MLKEKFKEGADIALLVYCLARLLSEQSVEPNTGTPATTHGKSCALSTQSNNRFERTILLGPVCQCYEITVVA